jgi:hypothetical protein
MSLTITAAQRDALYDQILDRLSGIGDIELAIQLENYDAAERLGREYSDDLRLLLEDLGIGDGSGEPSSAPLARVGPTPHSQPGTGVDRGQPHKGAKPPRLRGL